MFETVLNNDEHYELLKILVKSGAPYLYCEDSKGNRKETVVEKCMKRNDYYFFSDLVGINWSNPDLDEEIEFEWKKQLGRAVEAAAEANDVRTAELLRQENACGYSTHELAARGGWKYLKVFGADFDERDADGYTMLHLAAMNGKSSTVKYLLDINYWPMLVERNEQTPLHFAALFQEDNDLTLKLLIENTEINCRDINGVTVTQILAQKGKYHFIQRLLELGVNPDDHDNKGNFTFIEAAKNGNTLTVKELVVGGATIAMEDKNRMSALDHAMGNQKDETSAMLIRLDTRKNYMEFFNRKYEMSDHNIEQLIKIALSAVTTIGKSTRQSLWI